MTSFIMWLHVDEKGEEWTMGKFCVSKLIKPAESVFIQTENVIFELFIVCLNHSKKPGLKPC